MSIPDAPKGGLLSLQITNTGGNQNFDTFDTLNMFSKKGDGAAGMTATLRQADVAERRRAGLRSTASSPARCATPRTSSTYRFLLRPEARFADGSKLTAADVAFSLDMLKEKGHPIFSQLLGDFESAEAEADDVVRRALHQGPQPRRPSDRRRHADLLAGLVEDARFRRPDDGGAARLRRLQGRGASSRAGSSNSSASRIIGRKDLPVNVGVNNFEHLRFEYYRERQVAFEAFKAGATNFHEEYTSRVWAVGYDFPGSRDGRVKRRRCTTARRPGRRAGISIRGASSSRIRGCARRSACASISNGPTRT